MNHHPTRLDLYATRIGEWASDPQRACAGVDPELWFPASSIGTSGQVRTAKWLCGRCPVLAQCRAYALATPGLYGVWGGLTAKERRGIHRSAAASSSPTFAPSPRPRLG